jgi:hypothetical protein
MNHMEAFQVLFRRLNCDVMRDCAHSKDELPSVARGVIIQLLWYSRFPRSGLENAFRSSAPTGGLLPRCRYVFPPESHFFSDFRGKMPLPSEKFSLTPKKNDKPKNGYKKKNEDPLCSQNSQKRPLRYRVRTYMQKGVSVDPPICIL